MPADARLPGLLFLALLPTAPMVCAAEYLDIDAAQKAVFPEADTFQEIVLAQTPADRAALLERAGPQPAHGRLRVFRATRGGALVGHLLIDEVVGRQNLITYALGIEPQGGLRDLEIMAYRESHGGEIRNPAWRAQFHGRSELDQLRFRTDIKNISGATLSSEHVTQGVRWLLALWQATLRAQPAAG